ncbi:MAG: hypothetical protein KAR06_12965, partial [Deltaproteobacteria bacterium]|nr:hypothetical protein [Deltaproteobacteria bacterium]
KVLAVFKDIFSRFLITDLERTDETYIILEGRGREPSRIVVGERVYTVAEPGDLIGFAYMKITDAALSSVSSHYLFHASTISYDDAGIILPAASRSGKSTLALELVKRGFNFLSDDIAAISRDDSQIYPFPKKLGMLSPTLELCPEAGAVALGNIPMIGGGNKMLLDICDIYPGSLGSACPLRYIVFLSDVHGDDEFYGDTLYIVLSSVDDALIGDIGKMKGVNEVSIYSYNKHPILRLMLSDSSPSLFQIEEVCMNHNVLLFESSDGREKQPDFDGMPELKVISKTIATRKLFKKLKGGYGYSTLRNKCNGSITKLFMELGKVIEGADCFLLTPGMLKERADLICELVSEGTDSHRQAKTL